MLKKLLPSIAIVLSGLGVAIAPVAQAWLGQHPQALSIVVALVGMLLHWTEKPQLSTAKAPEAK